MRLNSFAAAFNANVRPKLVYLVASLFIAVALAGLLSTVSCAHTDAGLQRETQLYLSASNTTESLRHVTPYIPPPVSYAAETCLTIGGALLALWATHLQRSVAELRNGKPPVAKAPGPPAPAADGPPQA